MTRQENMSFLEDRVVGGLDYRDLSFMSDQQLRDYVNEIKEEEGQELDTEEVEVKFNVTIRGLVTVPKNRGTKGLLMGIDNVEYYYFGENYLDKRGVEYDTPRQVSDKPFGLKGDLIM